MVRVRESVVVGFAMIRVRLFDGTLVGQNDTPVIGTSITVV